MGEFDVNKSSPLGMLGIEKVLFRMIKIMMSTGIRIGSKQPPKSKGKELFPLSPIIDHSLSKKNPHRYREE
ncbi:hypothetical protein [Thermicanus aegyptius]|uniref:hypothetical protein n=1 Tax=Thermicanus aegyptius TaxID=94009 RepID=UPI00034ABF51|nr:hypothetical protein [Thermicanus aegyptius]